MSVFSDKLQWEESEAPHPIGSSTVLPARREDITLRTADGLALVGEAALPEHNIPQATLVTLHPLPTAGGFMESHIYRKAAFRLPALADIAVVRFNTRGTSSFQGRSEGRFDEGIGERFDMEAGVRWAVDRGLENIWLVGWSFGSELVLKYGAGTLVSPSIAGGILLSPPLLRATDRDLERWKESGKPLWVLVPDEDDYLRPAEARRRFSIIPQARLIKGARSKHLWIGSRQTDFVLNRIVEAALSGVSSPSALDAVLPLPTNWTGRFAYARDITNTAA